jgi:hypothetical protein
MANFTGDSGPNTIVGTSVSDQISGLEGNDILDGGGGDDVLIGGSGTDTLTGGTGADSFRDTAANFNGDRITDFLIGDRIQFTDLTTANANIHIEGSNLVYNGGSIQIDNLGPGRFVLREISTGGVEVRLQSPAHNDFNGDGRSDILWRDSNGTIFNFIGIANGGFVNNGDNSSVSVATNTVVAGIGDFDGDGRDDILWRSNTGAIFDFLATSNGGFTNNGDNSFVSVSTSTLVAGVGDFNGDGRSDILWRDTSGTIFNFLASANGGFTNNGDNSSVSVAASTQVAGVGDFNGDGLADLLWRDSSGAIFDFLGTPNGGFVNNGDNSFVLVPTTTQVAGIGDFNGDGLDDILWRNDTGGIFNFLGTANGGFVNNGDNSSVNVGTSFQIASIGDFNGDAIDDILWRNNTGEIFDFLGKSNGGFMNNGDNSFVSVVNTTHVQDPFL